MKREVLLLSLTPSNFIIHSRHKNRNTRTPQCRINEVKTAKYNYDKINTAKTNKILNWKFQPWKRDYWCGSAFYGLLPFSIVFTYVHH